MKNEKKSTEPFERYNVGGDYKPGTPEAGGGGGGINCFSGGGRPLSALIILLFELPCCSLLLRDNITKVNKKNKRKHLWRGERNIS